jgi:hypothetical protein
VIQTVLIDFPSAFLFGVLIALSAWRQIHAEASSPFSPYVLTATFLGVLYGIGVGPMCVLYPDWMWSYGIRIADWPLWLWYPAFVLGLGLAATGGAMMTQVCISRGRTWGAWLVGVVGLIVLAVLWGMTFDNYANLSTYELWQQIPRVAKPIQSDPTFTTAMSLVSVSQVLVGVPLLIKLFYDGRRLARHKSAVEVIRARR